MKTLLAFAIFNCLLLKLEGSLKCDDEFLSGRCNDLFRSGHTSECRGEALQLFPKCLFMASECRRDGQITKTAYTHSANVNYSKAYDKLIKRVKNYRRCFARSSTQCNESMIQECYETFERNSSKTCRDAHKLRFCILLLRPKGCHEMRNPWYTLAIGIIKSYRSCFIQNYTILLESLQPHTQVPSVGAVDVTKNNRTVISCTLSKKWDPSFTFLGAVVFCVLVIVTGLGMLFCVKRYGIQLKGRHRSLLNARRMRENELTDARVSRNCIANGRTPLTYVIEEDEAPPPYYAETGGLFPVDGIEFPPPYTSRPTSVNGDFV